MPSFVIRLIAVFSIEMRDLVPLLGKARNATSAKAQRVFGWKPRNWEGAIVATAAGLLQLKLVAGK
jgi:dihydroflavonol-4-reductase